MALTQSPTHHAYSTVPASASARQLWEQDRRHHLHPWQHFESFQRGGAQLLVRGEGCRLFDVDGRSYFDALGGLWCTNIGLGREEMAEAIAAQVKRLAYASPFTDMGNGPAAELAAKLAGLAPGDIEHVIYTCGGGTAVDSAARLALFYQRCRGKPAKRHFIARDHAYHGSTFLSASLTGKDRIPEHEYLIENVHFVSCPNPYRAPEGMDEAAFCDFLVDELERKILEIGPDRVCAFFAEPIMGAGGVIVPPSGYHPRTRELCARYDILYVADEVVTAYGRLGHWFASKGEFGIEPDIITCAKGLTSGYLPLGACLFSDRIFRTISQGDADRLFAHGFTYAGHPVACVAALKNLEIIEREKLIDNVIDVGSYFEQRLRELEDLPIVGNVRGRKLMMCVEFVADRATKETFPSALNIGKRVSNRCERMGLLVRSIVHLNVMSPGFTLNRSDVDFVVDTLRRGILEVIDELRAQGITVGT
jgi:adenosylmethionine-8-amino-7-oxononanoate aminotransferase